MDRLLGGMFCSLLVAGCGDGGGGDDKDGGNGCADVFTTQVKYAGQEVVVGCYYPGTYNITASLLQTKGTCQVVFAWQAASGSAHQCTATMSGSSSAGYDLDYATCSLPGSVHVAADLSTFTGHFDWTVGCGSGTTTFQSMTKQ